MWGTEGVPMKRVSPLVTIPAQGFGLPFSHYLPIVSSGGILSADTNSLGQSSQVGVESQAVLTKQIFTRLSIIVPVYNERQTVLELLRTVMAQEVGLRKELIVVDDFSTDGTREYLQKMDLPGLFGQNGDSARLVLHDRNRGKGAGVRTGLAEAKGELVLIQDADLEYDPSDFPALLKPILDGRADAVFGNRFHYGTHRVPRFYRYVLNRIFSGLCCSLTGLALHDVTACYKAFTREILDRIHLRSNRFSFETEITVKLAKIGARIYEVPIVYYGRTYAEGKKISWKDGVAALYHLFKYRFFD
jgi:glycosyltransferase involved in cell wall biosynthesis